MPACATEIPRMLRLDPAAGSAAPAHVAACHLLH
ncbi:hypothetical protein CNECB9_3680003 [Cupriavidus necator]|uniref:Uncharacterized protein n=1 Tax=Cupriavidus necator TaxID=106590 RepID=A0A1K0JPZ4_CUPNE|nr:hypothetical protein CNECB9_3680003 [Cupriavidus necator]